MPGTGDHHGTQFAVGRQGGRRGLTHASVIGGRHGVALGGVVEGEQHHPGARPGDAAEGSSDMARAYVGRVAARPGGR